MTVVEYSVSTGQFSGLMAHYSLVDLPFDLRASFRPDVCRSVTGHNWERFIVQYLCVSFLAYMTDSPSLLRHCMYCVNQHM